MIDLLKLSITNSELIHYFENHTLLDWYMTEDKINYFDLEVIKTKTVKHYKGIIFCFYSNRLEILFKPHYYHNNNLHNANDFNVIDCIKAITSLKTVFKIDLRLLKVVNIEFGINIISPIDVTKLVTYLLYHDKNEFRTDNNLSFSKKSFKSNSKGLVNNYKIIKGYAKGLQFPEYCNRNTFRFEIKSKQSKYINTLGIYTTNDLLNYSVYDCLGNEIIKEWNNVLLLDCETNFSHLKAIEQQKINSYLNTLTWFKISQDKYRNRFNKERNKYYNLINKIDDNLKKQLDKIIFYKIEFLKKGAISTQSKKVLLNSNLKSGAISMNSIKKKSSAISNIYKGGIRTSFDNSITNKPIELKNKILDWSYNAQKENIKEFNRIAVLKYNNRNQNILAK